MGLATDKDLDRLARDVREQLHRLRVEIDAVASRVDEARDVAAHVDDLEERFGSLERRAKSVEVTLGSMVNLARPTG